MAKAQAPEYFDFTVEGNGPFPFDMLRYDECWPVDLTDASKLDSEAYPGRRTIRLRTASRFSPHEGRWDSFTWKVVRTEASAT